MLDLIGITQNMLRCSVAYLLVIMKCTNALRGNYCSLDAAVTCTWNDIMYLLKGDRYERWTEENTLGDINGNFFSLLFSFFLLFTYSVDIFVSTLQCRINVEIV